MHRDVVIGNSNANGNGNSTSSTLSVLGPTADIVKHGLDSVSMAKVLGDRLWGSLQRLDRLRVRICDKTSRVLVTGDVNAGKSTFVNALIGSAILPTDQQPCTQSFCEVIPSGTVKEPGVVAYRELPDTIDGTCLSSSIVLSVEEMQESIQEEETPYGWYRVTWPVGQRAADSERFTSLPGLDISLIDSPGLNSDLFKTTALFSRQADIDVVIFLVNACNHLTLSAREFLERAGTEKEHVFVVVNRFDDIKNREKCKRLILGQIEEILPSTFEDVDHLVHFVSAQSFLNSQEEFRDSFVRLEACLREHLLENRTKSKLQPAQTLLSRIMADLELLLAENCSRLERQAGRLETELEMIAPCYEDLLQHDLPLRTAIQETLNETCQQTYQTALQAWCYEERLSSVQWPGIFSIFTFRKNLLEAVELCLEAQVGEAGEKAKEILKGGLYSLNAIASAHAHQVFPDSSTIPQIHDEESDEEPIVMIPEMSSWDVVDFAEELERLTTSKTWIGAGAMGAALFGYRPLLSLTLSIAGMKPSKMAILGASLAAGLIVIRSLDFESMVRRCVHGHIREWLAAGQPQREHARFLESRCRRTMMTSSVSLLARFDEALSHQRRLRSQKDMEHRQSKAVLAHFRQHHKALANLHADLLSHAST